MNKQNKTLISFHFRMTKTFSLVSHINYNLSSNEGFVMFSTSKLIICFIDGFSSKRISQSIAYLLNESEHILK